VTRRVPIIIAGLIVVAIVLPRPRERTLRSDPRPLPAPEEAPRPPTSPPRHASLPELPEVDLGVVAEILPGGGIRHHRLDPPAAPGSFASRLAALAGAGNFLPVVHPAGVPRTPANRRLLTRDLTVRLGDPLVRPKLPPGLVWKERPAFAPDHAVVSAADPLAALAAVEGLRRVRGIAAAEVQLAVRRYPRAMPADPLVAAQWHLKATQQANVVSGSDLNLEGVWNFGSSGGVRGAGVRIGIVDDGLELTHPDLAGNIDSAHHWDWNGGDSDPSPAGADVHGTPCAGIAAAVAGNGSGGCGVAPEATLVGLRLIAAPVTDSQEAAAFAHAAEAIQIKSNSWGPADGGFSLDGPGPLARAALAHAAATGRGGLGTIFVWAAGNGQESQDNSNYDGFANDIHTIAVAASDSLLRQAYYSEPGANVVVAAPSDGRFSAAIVTTDLSGTAGYNVSSAGGDYCSDFGGTSAAAPAVAAIVALMLEENPSLGWRDVQEILIRSARRINPSDPGWAENGAGLRFNPKFGGGLADAAAAVALAADWQPLAPAVRLDRVHPGPALAIPDHSTQGAEIHFTVAPANLRCEQVQLTFSASHTRRGDLDIQLVSPSGTVSQLAERHNSSTAPYSGWTFSSVHHWGEEAAGTWTLRISDRRSGVSGTLTAATLTLHGTPLAPVNPAPVVAITAPASGAVLGAAETLVVTVDAADLNADGSPGSVAKVELLNHGAVLAERTSPPFTFEHNPGTGTMLLTAVATDAEGRSATSAPVLVTVANQPPVIQAATVSVSSPAFADEGLAVLSITASDPDDDPLAFAYLWERSADGIRWESSEHRAAELPADPANAGRLWRCRVSATDGGAHSNEFAAGPVNLLSRPPTAVAGSLFSWTPGLVLPGHAPPLQRQAILHELSQGSLPGTGWIEILTLQAGSLAGWKLAGSVGGVLTFADAPPWQSLPAGTLLLIHRGGAKDPLLPPGNTNPAAGGVVVAHDQAELFDGGWPDWGSEAGSLALSDASGALAAAIAHGPGAAFAPALPPIGQGSSIYYADRSEAGVTDPAAWTVTSASVARRARVPRVPGDPFISEYVEGSSNHRALEIFNPGTSPVNLTDGDFRVAIHANGGIAASSSITLVGSIPPGGVFVLKHSSAAAAIAAQQVSGSLTFTGNDAVVLSKAGAVVDAIGRVGENPGSSWTGGGVSTQNATLRRKPGVATGDPLAGDPFDPSLEWTAHPADDFSGLGWHVTGGGTGLTLSILPGVVSETAGTFAAVGTVSRSAAPLEDLPVSLGSSLASVAVVPVEIVIPAGSDRATFPVAVIDDAAVTGTREVTIAATTPGQGGAVAILSVTDDEAPLDGVTPGAGNTPGNLEWIADLRAGLPDRTARFRLAEGSGLPVGLFLDPATGRISGSVAAAPGTYPLTIELVHDSGATVAHPFTLVVEAPADYGAWISLHPVADPAAEGDPDGDGLPNLLEYVLGGDPALPSAGLGPVLGFDDAGAYVEGWLRAGTDALVSVEWSGTLAADSWQVVTAPWETLETDAWRTRVRVRLPAAPGGTIFARLRAEWQP
jgi:subtilisin-like proprotein convertase family protein